MDTQVITLALFICFARMIDVSLNTLKLKSVMRGDRLKAFMLAFVEVIVYTLAASKAFEYVDNPKILIMYALGYATGNYIGIVLDEKISKENSMAIVISKCDSWSLPENLRKDGYAVTTSKGYGLGGDVKAELKIILPKNKMGKLREDIGKYDSDAFMAVLNVSDINRISVKK